MFCRCSHCGNVSLLSLKNQRVAPSWKASGALPRHCRHGLLSITRLGRDIRGENDFTKWKKSPSDWSFAELAGQPALLGYFIAGVVAGPGGFNLLHQLVQLDSVASLGLLFLLTSLGLEFSVSRIVAVRGPALAGSFLSLLILAVLFLCIALAMGAPVSEGLFVGAFVSMSSTPLVIKELSRSRQQQVRRSPAADELREPMTISGNCSILEEQHPLSFVTAPPLISLQRTPAEPRCSRLSNLTLPCVSWSFLLSDYCEGDTS